MPHTSPSLDERLIRCLLAKDRDFLSVPSLALEVQSDPEGVQAALIRMRSLGLGLEYQPGLGWRWGDPTDVLWADEIHARLDQPEGDFRWRLLCLEETDSTNQTALDAARRGEPAGLVVTANRQRAGRGRLGRRWHSVEPHGLYASVLLRPDWPANQLSRLTILAGLAAAEALEEIVRHPIAMKWPNDLIAHGRKLGGLLTEVLLDAGRLTAAVLGFGLNLHQQPIDFPAELQSTATSLRILTGQRWRRAEILTLWLRRLHQLTHEDPESVHARWSNRCLSLGQTITVHGPGGSQSGQALGLDPDGCLLLRLDSGAVERIHVGDLQPVHLPTQNSFSAPFGP